MRGGLLWSLPAHEGSEAEETEQRVSVEAENTLIFVIVFSLKTGVMITSKLPIALFLKRKCLPSSPVALF